MKTLRKMAKWWKRAVEIEIFLTTALTCTAFSTTSFSNCTAVRCSVPSVVLCVSPVLRLPVRSSTGRGLLPSTHYNQPCCHIFYFSTNYQLLFILCLLIQINDKYDNLAYGLSTFCSLLYNQELFIEMFDDNVLKMALLLFQYLLMFG